LRYGRSRLTCGVQILAPLRLTTVDIQSERACERMKLTARLASVHLKTL